MGFGTRNVLASQASQVALSSGLPFHAANSECPAISVPRHASALFAGWLE